MYFKFIWMCLSVGNNISTYNYLHYSIVTVLSFKNLGLTFVLLKNIFWSTIENCCLLLRHLMTQHMHEVHLQVKWIPVILWSCCLMPFDFMCCQQKVRCTQKVGPLEFNCSHLTLRQTIFCYLNTLWTVHKRIRWLCPICNSL